MHNIQPENIYNMDVKGFMLGEAMKIKIIYYRGRTILIYSQDGNRQLVTVIKCILAHGRVIVTPDVSLDLSRFVGSMGFVGSENYHVPTQYR